MEVVASLKTSRVVEPRGQRCHYLKSPLPFCLPCCGLLVQCTSARGISRLVPASNVCERFDISMM